MSDDRLSREHHVRRRAEQVHADFVGLWGDEPPPGPDPVMTTLVDHLALDDDNGRRNGLLVQGDAVSFNHFTHLLTTSSAGQEVLEQLPATLRARIDLAVATVDPGAMRTWATTRGVPPTPSGAFALHASPPVIDLDERVSSLLGLAARQHRLSWAQALGNVHPDDRDRVAEAVRGAMGKQASLSMRYRVVHGDGSVYWLSSVGHALTGEDGGTELVVGFTMPSP